MDITSYLLGKQAGGGGGGGGDTPTKGVILSEWDDYGYPHKAQIVGLTEIPDNYFYMTATVNFSGLITDVILPSNTTRIGNYAFNYTAIQQINLPNSINYIGTYAFQSCRTLTSITIPNLITQLKNGVFEGCVALSSVDLPATVTSIGERTFYNCTGLETIDLSKITTISPRAFFNCTKLNITKLILENIYEQTFQSCNGIKKLCLPNLTQINGTNINYCSFRNCINLKKVWIGSSITAHPLERYVFTGCTSLEKIYINLPRATVETFFGYSYAFMNDQSKTGIIVCNDDAGFITEEEFDALPVE